MLHAPVNENKAKDKQSKIQSKPESESQNRALGWAGYSSLGLGEEGLLQQGKERAQGWQPISLSPLPESKIRLAQLLESDDQLSTSPFNSSQQISSNTGSPSFVSGSLSIKDSGLTVIQQGGSIIAASMGFKIAKPFTVSANVKINEPANAEPFQYGIVQNLFFDHIEEVFTDGDILVDSVGPMVDINPDNPDEIPFIHENAVLPSPLFSQLSAYPKFDDVPSLELSQKQIHCDKSVDLVSVKRSVYFRAGLVAKGLNSKKLFPLAAIQTTYGHEWQVDFNGLNYRWSEIQSSAGSYPLSASAIPIETSGEIAGIEGQNTLNDETNAFKERCYNVL